LFQCLKLLKNETGPVVTCNSVQKMIVRKNKNAFHAAGYLETKTREFCGLDRACVELHGRLSLVYGKSEWAKNEVKGMSVQVLISRQFTLS
jgi:hypothetical protein